ncbi:hypothetical protein [Ferruginibacter profundus]
MKPALILTLFIAFVITACAQKQTFDVVSFVLPEGWQQQQNEGGLQLSVSDKKTGTYAIAVITKATASTASANENFNTDWIKLVKSSVQVNGEPTMQAPVNENGWNVISGSADYTDGANKGTATLLTTTGGKQTVSVVLMTNTKQYQKELLAFLNSLQLSKASQSTTAGNTINSPLAGKIWEGSSSEKFTGAGTMTGHYTGGFSTTQYKFNADGTYRFVKVRASHYNDTKTLEYETGTYSINSNQLAITPTKGQNEEWSKVGKTSNGNSDVTNRAINETWGKKNKTSGRKSEQYTYSFTIGKNGDKNALILQRSGRTEKEGEGKISYYNETAPGKSAILPSGIK